MANPVTELQQITNKSIIELYSVVLKADVHYTKSAKTATYSQSGQTITITLSSHRETELMEYIQYKQLQQILLLSLAQLHSQQVGMFLSM